VLDPGGAEIFAKRVPTPRGDYVASLKAIAALVDEAESQLRCPGEASIGVGMPGSISPVSGFVQNANSVWLNRMALDVDLEAMLGRPLRFANDANCLALSEATDGAGRGAASVFGVILGTGCGGGLVVNGQILNGPLGITGEWGHNPLPWAGPNETPGPQCWCGLEGCMETWVSGPALHRDYLLHGGNAALAPTAESLPGLIGNDDGAALAAVRRHASRLARGLASVVNLFDPHVIVLGGGLSKLDHLYTALPEMMVPYIFAERPRVTVLPPRHGDASGGRGAAMLWDM
jgi:fructokinase